ncbi:MAG: M48 family metalloprotease [Gammaproteobacteria bacterium]|nr:M48 family metalloprotease [Gammaproteobacteria bacterium]
MHARVVATVLVTAVICGLAGCATNPVSGSRDFVLLSEQQELALGREASQEIQKEYRRYGDEKLQAYVDGVGQRLAATSHRPDLRYQFVVVDSPDVNAFALPGGYIYITRGLLAYLDSEAQLAAVLGHEIGHVTARHAVRQYSAARAADIGALLGAVFIPGLGAEAGGQVMNTLGTALVRGYGRDQELEADRLGAEYLARTGYQPAAVLDVLRTLEAQERYESQRARAEGRPARTYHGLFSTHPDSDKRVQEAIAWGHQFEGGTGTTARDPFLDHVDGLVVGDSPHDGFTRHDTYYHPELGFALTIPDGWTVTNRPDRLLLTAPGGAASQQLLNLDRNEPISPRDYLSRRLRLGNLQSEHPIGAADLPGHTGVAELQTSFGQRLARVSVIYLSDRAFVLVGATRAPDALADYDAVFVRTTRSFRRLSARDAGVAQPLRIDVVTVAGPTTFAALAAKVPRADAEALLRLMNGRYPDGEPQPGERIKTLR